MKHKFYILRRCKDIYGIYDSNKYDLIENKLLVKKPIDLQKEPLCIQLDYGMLGDICNNEMIDNEIKEIEIEY